MAAVAHADVLAAAERIAPFVRRTPLLTSRLLDEWTGARVVLKGEHLQRTGAFKYRGATNAVRSLAGSEAATGVAAHSSGNHAAALALAARVRGIPCRVVMPRGAPAAKRAAVAAYGAQVVECEPTLVAREETLAAVRRETGAVEVHPYDDDRVIAGAGTAALELMVEASEGTLGGLDAVVAPVGGGGLLSGTALAVHGLDPAVSVIGAEPAIVDDAARSLAAGRLVPLEPTASRSMADGLLTSLSARTFDIISAHVDRVVTVSEHDIAQAMRFVWERTKQVVEASAAVAVAAVRAGGLDGARVGVIVSGGNADLDHLPW